MKSVVNTNVFTQTFSFWSFFSQIIHDKFNRLPEALPDIRRVHTHAQATTARLSREILVAFVRVWMAQYNLLEFQRASLLKWNTASCFLY